MNTTAKKVISILIMSLIVIVSLSGCFPQQPADETRQAENVRNIDGAFINEVEEQQHLNQNVNQQRHGQISSESTTLSSEEFPHTKAIQVQHARYDFVVDGQGDQQINNEQILMLPHQLARLPEDIDQLTPEAMRQLFPEGIDQLSQEEIFRRLREGLGNLQPDVRRSPAEGTAPLLPDLRDPQHEREDTVGIPEERGDIQPVPEGETPEIETPSPRREEPAPDAEQREGRGEDGEEPAPEEGVAPPEREEVVEEQPVQPEQPAQQEPAGDATDIERRVIELTNEERRRNGLADLQLDNQLNGVAREKSNDMQANNYFSHTSPTYGSPFDMMRDFGVDYNSAAENIAQGQRSAEEVVQAWMNSEGHRANIMSPDFTHIGVGYNENGNYWTQMFISR